MKKIKMMLLSLSLFAVVGAALAFKAKFDTDFCVTTESEFTTGLKCTVSFTDAQIDQTPGASKIYFTALAPANNDCSQVDCQNQPKVSLIGD
jgi:hypothetical protein